MKIEEIKSEYLINLHNIIRIVNFDNNEYDH